MQGLSMMGVLNELFVKRFRKRKGNEMETETKMTVRQALELIVENCNCPALNYAVNYAKYALDLEADGQLAELRIQLLYVVSNLSKWRASKAFQVTNEQIKECRAVLKVACK